MMKIYYMICILFCLYSINILKEEKNDVIYKKIDQKEPIYHLICFNVKEELYFNKTSIDLEQLNIDVYNYFNKLEYRYNFRKNPFYWNKTKDLEKYKRLILNPIKFKNYLLFRGLFCFIYLKENIDYLFIKSFFKQDLIYFYFKKDTFDLKSKSYNRISSIVQLVVINCVENYSKLKCLQKCFKKKNRLSKYIYNGNESGLIYLDYEYN